MLHRTSLATFILLAISGLGCVGTSRSDKGATKSQISPARSNAAASVHDDQASQITAPRIIESDETGTRSYRADANPSPSLKAYDKKMTDRVYERWRQENRDHKIAGRGVVTIGFRLGADGAVSDIHVIETSLQGAAVEASKSAVVMSAPFDPWPEEMHRLLKREPREILLNFRYTP